MNKAELLARLKVISEDKELRLANVTLPQLFLALSNLDLEIAPKAESEKK